MPLTVTASPRWLIFVALVLVAAGCSGPQFRSLDDYEAEIRRLEARLIDQPSDAEALRDLGVIYMRTRNYPRGYEYLRDAYAQGARDPETIYYLGLASEMLNRPETALELYTYYADVPATSPYRRLMRGRYELLARTMARLEMQARLLAPDTLAAVDPSPDVLAVHPLTYVGTDDRYAALSRGLAEMISADLVHVPGLRVVERARVQYLLDEMALAESEYMDPSTTPRTGRLLGAGRLVGGTFTVTSDDEARLDVAVSNVEAGTVQALPYQEGSVNNLLALQKAAVFALIDEFGIQLTPLQRERIQRIPTQNLEAFLAYSRGLEREDAGDIDGALNAYRQAVQLDPSFDAAVADMEEVESLTTAGTPEEAIQQGADVERAEPGTIDVVASRLNQLNTYLETQFVPGANSRQPASEATTQLPPPPPPPAN